MQFNIKIRGIIMGLKTNIDKPFVAGGYKISSGNPFVESLLLKTRCFDYGIYLSRSVFFHVKDS